MNNMTDDELENYVYTLIKEVDDENKKNNKIKHKRKKI